MKTTIEIPDALLIQARQLAARRGETLDSLIEHSLRLVVAGKWQSDDFRLRRATFKGEGMQADKHGAIWDRLREMAYDKSTLP